MALAPEAKLELEKAEAELKKVKAAQAFGEKLVAESAAKRKAAAEAEAARREAELEAQLAPAKQRELRNWLINHPDQTEAVFLAKVWPLVRENLLEDEKQRRAAAIRERLWAPDKLSSWLT